MARKSEFAAVIGAAKLFNVEQTYGSLTIRYNSVSGYEVSTGGETESGLGAREVYQRLDDESDREPIMVLKFS